MRALSVISGGEIACQVEHFFPLDLHIQGKHAEGVILPSLFALVPIFNIHFRESQVPRLDEGADAGAQVV